MTRKVVLITGGNFTNQGAYLMLCAAAEEVRERLGAVPAIAMQTGSEREKRWLGLDSVLLFPRFRFKVYGPRRGRLTRVRDRLPFVLGSDVCAVLDISGFVFGDEWHHLNLERRSSDLKYWVDKGVPLYLLPQSFGPFDKTAEACRGALTASRVVMARDAISKGHLDALPYSAMLKVRDGADFTVGVDPEYVSGFDHLESAVAIIPNWNIAARQGVSGRERYLGALEAWAIELRERGLSPYFLCHEGAADLALVSPLASKLAVEIVSGLNGRQSKYLLGKSRFVISGRFHGLVSSLSQEVPSIMHGWSHKYAELANDFRVSNFVSDPYDSSDVLVKLELLLESEDVTRQTLRSRTREIRESNNSMWEWLIHDLKSAIHD